VTADVEPDGEARAAYEKYAEDFPSRQRAAAAAGITLAQTSWPAFRDRWKRERRNQLEDEELRLRVAALRRGAEERRRHNEAWRGPFEHATLESVVKLREDRLSYDAIVAEVKISKRQVGYIAKAVDAKKVRSGRYGLEGELRTTADGVYVPRI
jgi:hypothetical protein